MCRSIYLAILTLLLGCRHQAIQTEALPSRIFADISYVVGASIDELVAGGKIKVDESCDCFLNDLPATSRFATIYINARIDQGQVHSVGLESRLLPRDSLLEITSEYAAILDSVYGRTEDVRDGYTALDTAATPILVWKTPLGNYVWMQVPIYSGGDGRIETRSPTSLNIGIGDAVGAKWLKPVASPVYTRELLGI